MQRRKPRIQEGDASVEGPVLWEGLFGSLEYTAIQNQERGTMLTIDYEDGSRRGNECGTVWKMDL